MATSTGKTIGLILLVAFIFLIAFRMTPLLLAPLGLFPGAFHWMRTGDVFHEGFFRFVPFSLITILLMILWIAVIIWVYRDAERRGMNGMLWALLVCIGNIIGLLIYLIVRSDTIPISQEPVRTCPCPNCEKPIGPNFVYCPHCGKRIQAVCPGCEKPVQTNWSVCPYCGDKLALSEK